MFAFNDIFPIQKVGSILVKLIVVCQVLAIGFSAFASEEQPRVWSTIKQENFIGHMGSANKALRGRVITFEPGAVAEFHVHEFPGIRIVLEGVVTVKWKDGNSETYKAGATFFEGPVGAKPARAHEVSNDGKTTAKIWLVEIISEESMQQ